MVARWGAFSMLLTADAEAESTPIDPGPVDVLKVAHHGSEDAGLGGLLERTLPRLAVISVGEDNTYGHPTAATLATLAAHGVPHPAHRPRRRGRHRGARRLGGGPNRSLSADAPSGRITDRIFGVLGSRHSRPGPIRPMRQRDDLQAWPGHAPFPRRRQRRRRRPAGTAAEHHASPSSAWSRPSAWFSSASPTTRVGPTSSTARFRAYRSERVGEARIAAGAVQRDRGHPASATASHRSAPAGKAQLVPDRSSGPHVTSQQEAPVTVSDGHVRGPAPSGHGGVGCAGASRSGAGRSAPQAAAQPPAAQSPAAAVARTRPGAGEGHQPRSRPRRRPHRPQLTVPGNGKAKGHEKSHGTSTAPAPVVPKAPQSAGTAPAPPAAKPPAVPTEPAAPAKEAPAPAGEQPGKGHAVRPLQVTARPARRGPRGRALDSHDDGRGTALSLPDRRHRRRQDRRDPGAAQGARRVGGRSGRARGLRGGRGPRRSRPRGAARDPAGDVADRRRAATCSPTGSSAGAIASSTRSPRQSPSCRPT